MSTNHSHASDEVDELDPDVDVKPTIRSKPNAKRAPGKRKSDAVDDDSDPGDTRPSKKKGGGKKWSGPELVALLDAALKGNGFENAVPGRTRNQSDTTWRNTVYPMLVHTLQEKGGDDK